MSWQGAADTVHVYFGNQASSQHSRPTSKSRRWDQCLGEQVTDSSCLHYSSGDESKLQSCGLHDVCTLRVIINGSGHLICISDGIP